MRTRILTILAILCMTAKLSATIYSGSCGAHLNWTLDTETGVLQITGYGDMTDFYIDTGEYMVYPYPTIPWKDYVTYITNVSLPEGLTGIGKNAFIQCNNLASVTIPNTITSIGEYAFDNCTGLKGVYITDIATWCNITFAVPLSNPLAYAHHLYLNGELVEDLIIPNETMEIKDYAFYAAYDLKNITIPNTITSIGKWVFRDNYSLTSIILPQNVSIGEYALYGCSNLASIILLGSATIGCAAFDNCNNLQRIVSLSLTPPSTRYTLCSDNRNNIDLYIRCYSDKYYNSLRAYSYDGEWGQFKSIQCLADLFTITTLANDDNWGSVTGGGEYAILSEVSLTATPAEGYEFVQWSDGNTNNPRIITVTDNATYTAEFAETTPVLTAYMLPITAVKWYFVAFPFDVQVSDLHLVDADGVERDFVIAEYNGEKRANQGYAAWELVETQHAASLQRGKGYAIASDYSGTLQIPMLAVNENDFVMPLEIYPCKLPNNAGWNFIGNPFAVECSLDNIDYTAPITVWNAETQQYETYRKGDDTYIIKPFEAFFVQQYGDVNSITFQKPAH